LARRVLLLEGRLRKDFLLEGQPGGVMVRVNRTTEHGGL